jgi:hypothetical protein
MSEDRNFRLGGRSGLIYDAVQGACSDVQVPSALAKKANDSGAQSSTFLLSTKALHQAT